MVLWWSFVVVGLLIENIGLNMFDDVINYSFDCWIDKYIFVLL